MSTKVSDIKTHCWCPGPEIREPSQLTLSLFPLTLESGILWIFSSPACVSPRLNWLEHAIKFSD
jgi:hypothetical protein